MATTVLGAIFLVFVNQLQTGASQPLGIKSDADRCNAEIDPVRNLKLDLQRQINDVERLKEELSETITKVEAMIKRITECPNGWERYRQSCYMLNTQNLAWSVAAESCRNLSAYLVEIDSRGENDFIQKMLKENANRYYSTISLDKRQRVWLGSTNTTSERTWIWNFSELPLRFKHWAKGEPSNAGGNEKCMEIWVEDGVWNDINCSESFASVCEKDLWV